MTDLSTAHAPTAAARHLAPVVVVDGDKGGVGKSFLATMLSEALLGDLDQPMLIDADDRNPSLRRQLGSAGQYNIRQMPVRTEDEWMALIDVLAERQDVPTLIDLPAGAGRWISQYGDMVIDGLQSLGRPVHYVWTLDQNNDALQSLAACMPHILAISASLLVVKNGKDAEEHLFAAYAASKVGRVIDGETVPVAELAQVAGAKLLHGARQRGLPVGSMYVPKLHIEVAKRILDNKRGIRAAIDAPDLLTFMHRRQAVRWFEAFSSKVADAKARGLL